MNYNDNLRILSIIRNKALLGPKTLDVLITSECNLKCIYCTIHSFFNPKKIAKRIMPLSVIKKIIDSAAKLGTDNITLSGDGEPSLHPDISEIINYVKTKGLFLNINTNLAFSKTKTLRSFLKVDKLSVNL